MNQKAFAGAARRVVGQAAGDAGFTLIEIIVVLVILGAMVGLLVTRGPVHSAALDLRAVANTMAEAMRGARVRAIATDKPVTFTLDVARHVYQIDGSPPAPLPVALGLSMRSAAGEAAGPQRGGISFAPDGSSTGGEVDLAAGERHVKIGVNWLTGRVSIADGA